MLTCGAVINKEKSLVSLADAIQRYLFVFPDFTMQLLILLYPELAPQTLSPSLQKS